MSEAQFWDEKYEEFKKVNIKRETKNQENSEFFKLPSEIKTALDIGCGTGEDMRNWAMKKVQTTGWDISKVAIRIAKENAKEEEKAYMNYEIGDWKELSKNTKKGTYDLVYSVMGPKIESIEEIKEISRLSKKYIRLLQFVDGKTEIFEEIEKYLRKEKTEEKNENETIKNLEKLKIPYETKKIEIFEKIEQPLENWISYFKNTVKSEEEFEKIKKFLTKKSEKGKIKTNIKATYLQITWKV